MTVESDDLGETPVRIPGTRPAMKFGMPVYVWAFMIVLPTEMFVIHKPWAALYLTLSVGVTCWIAFKYDHNILRIEAAYWRTRGRDVLRFRRGGRSSVSAFPVKPWPAYRGIPASGMRADSAGV